MKSFIKVFFFIVSFALALLLANGGLFSLLTKTDAINANFEISENMQSTNNLGFLVEKGTAGKFVNYIRNGEVVGECVWLAQDLLNLNKLCEKLALTNLKKYYVGERYIIEGSSPLLKYSIDGKSANVQIACYNQTTVVGSPIIYGSY